LNSGVRTTDSQLSAIVSICLGVAACSGNSQGNEGGPCYPNGTCNSGLSCSSNHCVGGGSGSDASGGMTSCGASATTTSNCTITQVSKSTVPDSSCYNNCADSVDPDICGSGCGDITTSSVQNTPGLQCGGTCVDFRSDENCGSCGNACQGGTKCIAAIGGGFVCITVGGSGGLGAACTPGASADCGPCFECFGVPGAPAPRCNWPEARPASFDR
jgi:hypothetical protein